VGKALGTEAETPEGQDAQLHSFRSGVCAGVLRADSWRLLEADGLVALALAMNTRRSLKLGAWAAGFGAWSRRRLPDLGVVSSAQARTARMRRMHRRINKCMEGEEGEHVRGGPPSLAAIFESSVTRRPFGGLRRPVLVTFVLSALLLLGERTWWHIR